MASFDEKVEFEKIRVEHIKKMYDQEEVRRVQIEEKTRFYFSIITLTLGATFLNLEILKSLKPIMNQPSVADVLTKGLYALGICLITMIFLSLLSVLQVFGVARYKNVSTQDTRLELFGLSFEDKNTSDLLYKIGLDYAHAYEDARKINNKKAFWLQVTSITTAVSLIALIYIVAILASILLN